MPDPLGWINRIRHPLLTVFLIGTVIRIAIGPLSIVYDSDFWVLVIRNLEAGEGLYGMHGYFYTPVWGYILGLVAALQDVFLDIGESAVRVTEALFVEGSGPYFSATIPSLAMIYSIKVPLYICDAITAFVVMKLVEEKTEDRGKALLAFTLTFLSPVLLMSSGVISMPDTISAMFAVLTIYCLTRGHHFVAGMTFSIAVLVKFFPAFMIFVLVGYILARDADDTRRAMANVGVAALGAAAIVFAIFLPQIMEGSLESCFRFISDRTGTSAEDGFASLIAGIFRFMVYGAVLLISVYIGHRMSRCREEDLELVLMRNCFVIATLLLVYPPTTQYIVILVPFLAYWIAVSDRRFILSWKILAVGAMIYESASIALQLLPSAVWAGVPSIDFAVSAFSFMYSPFIGPVTLGNIQFIIGGVLQCFAIFLTLWMMFGGRIRERIGYARASRRDSP